MSGSSRALHNRIVKLHEKGELIKAVPVIQDWLQQNGYDPKDYQILLHEKPAPPNLGWDIAFEIELRRHDKEPTNSDLLQKINTW